MIEKYRLIMQRFWDTRRITLVSVYFLSIEIAYLITWLIYAQEIELRGFKDTTKMLPVFFWENVDWKNLAFYSLSLPILVFVNKALLFVIPLIYLINIVLIVNNNQKFILSRFELLTKILISIILILLFFAALFYSSMPFYTNGSHWHPVN
jgi:hypothetical protein